MNKAAVSLLLALAMTSALPSPVPAVETQRLPLPVFRAWFNDSSGRETTSPRPGDDAVLNVTFALALSEVRSYPVTLTLTMGGEEIRIFDGRLDEGFWNVTEKVRIKRGPWKVILRIKVTNRTEGGSTTFSSYTTAEGTF